MVQILAQQPETTNGLVATGSTSGAELPERPALAPLVQLVGEVQGTGFEDRQWLIERNGAFLQVSEPVYRIAEQANGERTLDGVQYYEVTDRAHVEIAVDYPQTPPVGGNHAPIWQNCGFYAEPVADETAVH